MIAFLILLVDLISGKQKLIHHLIEQGAETLLILGFQSQIIEADMERSTSIISFALFSLVVGIFIDMPINLMIIHQLGCTDIVKRHFIFSGSENICMIRVFPVPGSPISRMFLLSL